ncbi:MAG TPA: ABC transporter ATP-binding protein [Planctomycetota bacterium]|nr:ABC transporter ATP-binding protein [Planctomycetota bacterium]
MPLLKVENLKKYFPVRRGLFHRTVGHVRAVDDVDLAVEPGQCASLVGESGCGKTTIGRTILNLMKADGGRIVFRGQDITGFNAGLMRPLRRHMQLIFQDPFASLNPRFTVGNIIGEGISIYEPQLGRGERAGRVRELLETVGLPADSHRQYPHEFSGGQRQRIGIARAIALNPEFIVCDEPVSALDVSVQAQIINLLQDLRDKFGLSYLFIAHDLAVVKHISDHVNVMYLGRIMESAPKLELFDDPRHPYTLALLSAVPVPDPKVKRERIILKGNVPSPLNPPSGCPFHPRCSKAMDRCSKELPPLFDVSHGHTARCWLAE